MSVRPSSKLVTSACRSVSVIPLAARGAPIVVTGAAAASARSKAAYGMSVLRLHQSDEGPCLAFIGYTDVVRSHELQLTVLSNRHRAASSFKEELESCLIARRKTSHLQGTWSRSPHQGSLSRSDQRAACFHLSSSRGLLAICH